MPTSVRITPDGATLRDGGHRAVRRASYTLGVRQTPEEQVTNRIVTIPNLLSLVRIALIPVFLGYLLTGADVAALITLVVASLTDFLDGFLARRLHQVSRVGQILDPIGDRLCIFAVTLGLAWRDILPWWLVIVVFAREAFLLVLGVLLARYELLPMPVSMLGKTGTFILLAALPILVLGYAAPGIGGWVTPIGIGIAVVGAVVYWCAGIGYAFATARMIRERRDDTPTSSVTLVDQRRPPNGR